METMSPLFRENLTRAGILMCPLWNRVEVSFNAIDGFGMPIATAFRVTESTANNTWVFTDTTGIFSQGGPNPFFLELDRALRAPFAGE